MITPTMVEMDISIHPAVSERMAVCCAVRRRAVEVFYVSSLNQAWIFSWLSRGVLLAAVSAACCCCVLWLVQQTAVRT